MANETSDGTPLDPAAAVLVPEFAAAFRQYQQAYARLHDAVSDCIEGGRINVTDLPDDYAALVELCERCVGADHVMTELLKRGKVKVLDDGERRDIAEFIAGGANRIEDTLKNPLERPHYSDSDIVGMELKVARARQLQSMFEGD